MLFKTSLWLLFFYLLKHCLYYGTMLKKTGRINDLKDGIIVPLCGICAQSGWVLFKKEGFSEMKKGR